MDIREKSEPERVITGVFSTTLGNLKGWSRANVGHGSHQFYPETLWEPVPVERWATQFICTLNDGRTIRFVHMTPNDKFAIGAITDVTLPDGVRAVIQAHDCVTFERRVPQ